MKNLFFIIFILISTNAFSAVTTQYPGCSPTDSTAAELDTKPTRYYPVEAPLNKDAIEANQAIRQQGQ